MKNNINLIILKKIANSLWFVFTVIVLILISGATICIFAAFIEPTVGPSVSDQDFVKNILGANNADNDYDSSLVVSSSTGSIFECLHNISDEIYKIQEYPGRGWIASSSGDGSTALTESACDDASGWYWFEDANGDGDMDDKGDGICVQETAVSSGVLSWNGYAYTSSQDNTYIADYECEGNFPSGTIKTGTYNGFDSGGSADTTWDDGDCALCQTDCYDGKKDLPDQGSYTSNAGGTGGYIGPITPEVLKNWKGTRLPTYLDFYGFCGYKDGGSDYETGCSSVIITGTDGQMIGRTDECLDLSNSSIEWISEKIDTDYALIAGDLACSNVHENLVHFNYRFRAIFRP